MLEITIEEVSGPRRKIVLRGQSLPETKDDRVVLGATMARGKLGTPPGNTQADVALSSAVWLPTTLQGRWADRFMWDDRNAPTLLGFAGQRPGVLRRVGLIEEELVDERQPLVGRERLEDAEGAHVWPP